MTFEADAEWIEFIGGTSPYREAVRYAFQGGADSLDDSIEVLAGKLEVYLSVVFCDSGAALGEIERRSADSDRYVIAIVPDLDVATFHRAFVAGASGMVWEDTPTSHLAVVTRAALHGDVLMPAQVLASLMSGGHPVAQRPIETDFDPGTLRLLNALSEGASIHTIAADMAYSDRTIQRKITNLCLALGAKTPAGAVHVAHRNGLLQ